MVSGGSGSSAGSSETPDEPTEPEAPGTDIDDGETPLSPTTFTDVPGTRRLTAATLYEPESPSQRCESAAWATPRYRSTSAL